MTKTFDLRSEFETYGLFWNPNDDKRLTGRLARTKEGINLTSSPVISQHRPFHFGSDQETIDLVQGATTEGLCTLYYLQSPISAGFSDYRAPDSLSFREYRVGLCVFGLHLPDFETPFRRFGDLRIHGIAGVDSTKTERGPRGWQPLGIYRKRSGCHSRCLLTRSSGPSQIRNLSNVQSK